MNKRITEKMEEGEIRAYIFTKYDSDKRDHILERKVIIADKKNRWDVMKIDASIPCCEWEERFIEIYEEIK